MQGMTDTCSHDVAIAGAGLSGRLMALALGHYGFNVALIDPSPAGGGAQDGRTTALAYASVRLLQRLGLWSSMATDASPINDILVTQGVPADSFRTGKIDQRALHFPSSLLPEAEPEQGGPLGYIIENRVMNEVFEAAVQKSPTITCYYGAGVAQASPVPGQMNLTLSDQTKLVTSLLLAADGKNSPLRDQFGIRTITWKYWQKALVFNIRHTESHQGVAHEIFYPSGPFAILPMKGNQSSIVWTETKDKADGFLHLPDDRFLSTVRDRVGDHLGDIAISSARATFPLRLQYASTPIAERLALIGDASHTIHPIAGQGFNLGIKDIAALAAILDEGRQTGLDIGHGAVLDRYTQWRRFDTTTLALGTDLFNRLFSNDLAPVRWLRGTGLNLVNKIDPARQFFMRHAGADVGDLPALMRPL